jgi:hypothetical protein
MDAPATMQEPERRKRIRRTALTLTAFAVLIYIGFIVIFINSRT